MMENSRQAWARERPCHRNFEVLQVPAGRFLKDSQLKRKALEHRGLATQGFLCLLFYLVACSLKNTLGGWG